MNRIEIRGVIVSSDFDAPYFSGHIDRGVITPESRARLALAAMRQGDDVEIYINSPGGFVFAGNEILNAINDAAARGVKVTLTVGAYAASIAAAIIAQARGVTVRAHRNSKLMFHGAYSITVGGEQIHRDEAELLARINADIKQALVARGADAAKIADWFAEGREGWINAAEAVEIGLVHEIVDADDELPAAVVRASDVDELAQYDIRIAACDAVRIITDETQGEAAAASPAPDQPRGEPVSMSSSDPIAALEQRIVELEAAAHAADERARAVQASKDRQITELASRLTEITKTRDELADASESLRRALADAEARIAKLLGAALSPLSEPTTWAEALGACNGDYVEACRRYPQLRLDLIRRANRGQ